MKKLIKNAKIANESEVFEADILIDGEKISEIGKGIEASDAEIINANGCYVIPGGVLPVL